MNARASHGEMPELFQFKITLNESVPTVWRRILVPKDYSFFNLHIAIQDAMGWTDSHLHRFRIAQSGTAKPVCIEFPNPEDDDQFVGNDTRDERTELVTHHFGTVIKQCVYDYDFGDGWTHTVLFEKKLPAETGKTYPQCIAGKNACPPEDCGGVGGYDDLRKILKNPKHPEHQEMLEWLCIESADEFNTHEFDPAAVEFEDPKSKLQEWNKGFGVA
jgi:hypothetical protein